MVDQANDYVKGLSRCSRTVSRRRAGRSSARKATPSTDKDFSAILAKVKAAKPDVVYLPDYYNVVNLVTKQAKEKGITVPFVGGDGWDSSDLDLKAADGGYYTNHYSPDDPRPEVKNFLTAYGAEVQGRQREGHRPRRPRGSGV